MTRPAARNSASKTFSLAAAVGGRTGECAMSLDPRSNPRTIIGWFAA